MGKKYKKYVEAVIRLTRHTNNFRVVELDYFNCKFELEKMLQELCKSIQNNY